MKLFLICFLFSLNAYGNKLRHFVVKYGPGPNDITVVSNTTPPAVFINELPEREDPAWLVKDGAIWKVDETAKTNELLARTLEVADRQAKLEAAVAQRNALKITLKARRENPATPQEEKNIIDFILSGED